MGRRDKRPGRRLPLPVFHGERERVRGGSTMPRIPADSRVAAGVIALAAIALLIGGAFAGLLVEGLLDLSGAAAAFDPYLLRIAWFTLWQAALSTVLSVAPAIFVARALSRHPTFPGRAIILRL